ncbi:MAG: T9SS type A sorting domain-containing protein [Bacteroidia bacterium]
MASKRPLIRQIHLLSCLCLSLLTSTFFPGIAADHTHDPLEIRLASPQPYHADRQATYRAKAAWQNFFRRHPQWNVLFDEHTGQPHRLFGPAIAIPGWSTSVNPQSSAETGACLSFLEKELEGFGIPLQELRNGPAYSSAKYRYRWMEQWHRGMKVIGGRIGFKMSPEGGLVWLASELHPRIQFNEGRLITPEQAQLRALESLPAGSAATIEPDLQILPIPGKDAGSMFYHRVYTLTVEGQRPGSRPYRYLCHVDAVSGKILMRQDQIVEFAHGPGSNGNLTMVGRVYPKHPFAPLDSARPLPHLKFTVNGNTYYTSASGSYDLGLPNLPVTGTFPLEGRFSKVVQGNNGTTSPTFSLLIDAARDTVQYFGRGTSTSLWNQVPHLSAYYHTNRVHDYMKSYLPNFTALDIPLTTKVERTDGNCNAFFNGNSINFYTQAAGCNTLANVADVVYHEYGHAITNYFYNALGTPFRNGAVGEGYSDVYAITLTDTPVLGVGFNITNPNLIVRRYDINPKIYPQNLVGQVHADGEIICGAWWRTARNMNSNAGMMAIFSESLYGLANGPNGSEGVVYTDILIDALQADDNDNNLSNGTPNMTAILQAFAFHGIRMLANVSFQYNPLPDVPALTPSPISLTLNITPPFNSLVSGARLIYRLNNNPLSSCDTVVLTQGTGGNYTGTIPGQPRGTIVRYYVGLTDLTGVSGGSYPPFSDLSSNPGLWFNFLVGFQNLTNLDLENPAQDSAWLIGWSTDNATTGRWELGVPIPSYSTPGNPATIVQTGSNATPGGTRCAFTGNAFPGDDPDTEDVDGGRTTLRTPNMDLSNMTDPVLAYHRWFTNDTGDNPGSDFWEVYINNGTTTWKLVERTNRSDRQWRRNVFRVSDYVTPNATVQLRFIANDQAPASTVEAAVDRIQSFVMAFGAGATSTTLAKPTIFPNPFRNQLVLEHYSSSEGDFALELTTADGRIALRHPLQTSAGPNRWEIDTPELPAGLYYARFVDNNGSSSVVKLVKKP